MSILGLISHYLNDNKKLFCVFIDFSKTFDFMVRDNLWYKLIKLGLVRNILNIVMSMYQNVKPKVKFDGEKGYVKVNTCPHSFSQCSLMIWKMN